MNNLDLQDQSPRSSSEIQTDIEDTRKRMDSTLDELSNRLTPRSLMNTAMDWWDDKNAGAAGKAGMTKTYRVISTQIKQNPAPALLIGAGLAWLFLKSDEDNESYTPVRNKPYPHLNTGKKFELDGSGTDDHSKSGVLQTLKEKAGEAKDAIGDFVDDARQKTDHVREGAADLGHKARHAYESGKETIRSQYDSGMEHLRNAVDDYPLAIGAAFLALGALAGVVLPASRREDRMLGEKSDELKKDVKEKGREILDLGKEKAGELGESLLAEAEARGITPETVGAKISEVATQAGGALRGAVEEAASTVKQQAREDDPGKQPVPPSFPPA